MNHKILYIRLFNSYIKTIYLQQTINNSIMKKLDNYSEDEWTTVLTTPQLVGMAMTGAASSGLIGSTKEMFASARSMMSAKKEYESNVLIQSLLPDTTDVSKAMEDAKKQRTVIMDLLKSKNVKSSEDLSEIILADCKTAISVLEQKELPEVVADYKQWLLDIAEKVANAAKEGGFLGFGGEQFSEKEQILFDKLKSILE